MEEVKAVYRTYPEAKIALNAIGYKEFFPYLQGEITLQQAVELVKRNTRRFAKRQLTWFNRDKRILWFDVCDYSSEKELIKDVVDHITLKKGRGE